MTPQYVISQLLESDTNYPKNLDLLKKIILTTYLGRFRVNGLSPDNKITLGNYLFDEERVMFDYTRLSDEKKALFFNWLLEPHKNERKIDYLNDVHINEYRGFTAEVALNWWGRLISWFENRSSEHWKITDLNLSLNYQLTGIEICHGAHGSLIGFNQFAVPNSGTKYKATDDPQKEPLGNTKRVFITDNLVDQLIKKNPKSLNFESICRSPHPQSIEISNYDARHVEMRDYRSMQKFIDLKPWYVRIWRWLESCFFPEKKIDKPAPVDNSLRLLYENDTVQIYQRDVSAEILVKEKRPDINNLVLCGGGGKIFAHIGVWKALGDAKIKPQNFAGSSAGAIISLFCYLGYTADEIIDLFKHLKQEHIVFFDIDRNGFSDAHSLKSALDYAIAFKLKQIVDKYKIPYPEGLISFSTLEEIRKQFPDCGIGKELIVTATNKRLRQTQYFSLARTPAFEVSEAVKISASLPVVYRGTRIDNDELIDGGVTSNLPTEVFRDANTTLLEHEFYNNLELLAVQFDNGTERSAIDKIEKVYRENFFLNWIYGLLTGVSDPATSWEQDRMKLRKYASQSIVINVENVSTSSFNVEDEVRNEIINSGDISTKNYLEMRYEKKEDGTHENQECMYSTFSSLGDLLAYCCYRGDSYWFEIVNNLIEQSSLPNKTALLKQSSDLRQLYFNTPVVPDPPKVSDQNTVTFFGNAIPQESLAINKENRNFFLAVYPIFLKMSSEMVKINSDKKILETARHSVSLQSPFRCLEYLSKLKNEVHVVLHIFIKFIQEIEKNPTPELYGYLKDLCQLIYSNPDLTQYKYFGDWDLSTEQCLRVMKLINGKQHLNVSKLLEHLRRGEEPLQTVRGNVFYDDFSTGNLEEDSELTFGV